MHLNPECIRLHNNRNTAELVLYIKCKTILDHGTVAGDRCIAMPLDMPFRQTSTYVVSTRAQAI